MRRSFIALIVLLILAAGAEGSTLNLVFNCVPNNDLYRVLAKSGHRCPRYDTALDAVERAKDGSAVLILADGYPDKLTRVEPAVFETAARKNLRLYVEFPASIPGVEIGAPQSIVWERAVVSSDAFGDALPKLRILTINDCRYTPVAAPNPMIVIARAAGYDTAVYGIPESAQPILFEMPDRNLLIATTKLSNFVTGRYAPTADWKTIWECILARLDPECRVDLEWTPDVRPAYGASDKLPADVEKRALRSAAEWIHSSRLLIHESDEPAIHEMLRANAESRPVPGPDHPVGDGSLGILEGYASAIRSDGSQLQRVPIRSDCNAEVAIVLALDWALNRNERSRDAAGNLLDYIYFTSGMCGGVRGDPKRPAFGLI
ncbi:MAG: hypothetical protein NTU88_15180, partial [Armatimonadetes bacterium]|nr:hypothetical protein [Armatimonadota bacterium]